MTKRLHVYYSGSVQGVGFRFAAERIANSLSLTGWVRNLRDGRVEVVCEGRERPLNEFLERIDLEFKGYVRDRDMEWSDAAGEAASFNIRF